MNFRLFAGISVAALAMQMHCSEAGQDLFALDYDPVAELQAKGIDTTPQSLEAIVSNPSVDWEIRSLSAVAIGQSGDERAFQILRSQLRNL